MKNKISIALSADKNFSMPLAITISSILKNKNQDSFFYFYILDGGLDENDKNNISKTLKKYKNFLIKYLKIDQREFLRFPEIRNLKRATYYRLILPSKIEEEKIIYLDCDIIVEKDLTELFKIDLGENIIGAIKEVSSDFVIKYYFRPIKKYFNAGVMLIDCKKYRESKIWQKALKFILNNRDKVKYADQDILNHLLENDWLELDKKFNTQLDIHQKKGIEEKSIFHFVGAIKPWHYRYNNSYKNLFLKYLKESPWSDYKYPDKTFLNILKRFLLDPTFLISKNILKLILPKFMLKKLKNKFWEISNKRDSK